MSANPFYYEVLATVIGTVIVAVDDGVPVDQALIDAATVPHHFQLVVGSHITLMLGPVRPRDLFRADEAWQIFLADCMAFYRGELAI